MSNRHIEYLEEQCEPKKKPTIEQVKKEWEELGFIWQENNITINLKGKYGFEIIINKSSKGFAITKNMLLYANEYKLLTKTFKVLGWETD